MENESYKYYGDIINRPRHISSIHAPMSIMNRAAQFTPFAALPGHSQSVTEAARQTETYLSLDEEEKERINCILQSIIYNTADACKVSIKYFIEDERKSGGRYIKTTGVVRKIDTYNKVILLDNIKINIEDIVDIIIHDNM